MTDHSEYDAAAKGPVLLGLAGILALILGVVFWGLMSRIAGAVVAPGQIEIEQNRQIVQHRVGGVVTAIHVQDGANVPKGAVLLQLDSTALKSQLATLDAQQFDISVKMARLHAAFEGADSLVFAPELRARATNDPAAQEMMAGQYELWQASAVARSIARGAYEKQKTQLAARITGHNAQKAALSAQLALLHLDLGDRQALFDKGLAVAASVRKLKAEKARLVGALADLDATSARIREGMLELDLLMQRDEAKATEQALSGFRDLRSQERALDAQNRALRDRIAEQSVRAPVAGVVYGLRIQTPQAVIQSAEPLMYIIPQDRPLLIAAQVDPAHIALVFVGQSVGLRLNASGQQAVPELQGVVRHISADTFTNPQTGSRYFRVEISLTPDQIDGLGGHATFRLGMSIDAVIKLQERPPIVYLLEPVAAYFSRAFRES